MRWMGISGFRWGNLRESHDLENLGIDMRIIFKWDFKK
jgi:hypothetical protein